MMPLSAVEWVRLAVLALKDGQPGDAEKERVKSWRARLSVAHKRLCLALREANRAGQNEMKRRIMRMINWVRTEFYRTRKVLACS